MLYSEVGCFDERTRAWKSYAFDKVWGPEMRQKDVFQDVEPMALSVIDGYNACIFAYGQSKYDNSLWMFSHNWTCWLTSSYSVTAGSGKTYTMEGGGEGQYGISQRIIQKLFHLLHEKSEKHRRNNAMKQDDDPSLSMFESKIEISMLEIYNDEGKLELQYGTSLSLFIAAI